jgi:hypothetical protein
MELMNCQIITIRSDEEINCCAPSLTVFDVVNQLGVKQFKGKE